MRRRKFIRSGTVGAVVATGLAGCTGNGGDGGNGGTPTDSGTSTDGGGSDAEYNWTLSGVYPSGHPWITPAEIFAEKVATKSNGRMQIDVATGGQYGSAGEEVELLAAGGLDFVINSISYESTVYYPSYLIQTNHMFVIQNNEHYLNILDEVATGLNYDQQIEEQGIKRFGPGVFVSTLNVFGADGYPSPSAVNNVDCQIPPAPGWPQTYSAIGFNPQEISSTQHYQALQTGQVSAVTNDISGVRRQSLYEVGDSFTQTDQFYVNVMLKANLQLWESLSETDRQILLEAANEMKPEAEEQNRATIQEDEEFVQDQGVDLVEIDRQAYLDTVVPVVKQIISNLDNPVLTYEEMMDLAP